MVVIKQRLKYGKKDYFKSMKKSEVKILHSQLIKYLKEYYEEMGFLFDPKESSFELDNVKVIMDIETQSGPYYTIRPNFFVIYRDILSEISVVISEYSDSNFLKVFFNSYFYLDNRLAVFLNCNAFDECQENNYNKDTILFEHRISNSLDVLKTFSRHKLYMETVGFDAIQICNSVDTYYNFLKKIYLELFEDLVSYPNKRPSERPRILKPNDIYTLVYIGKKNDNKFVEHLLYMYEKLFGEYHQDQISIAKLILHKK